MNSYLLPCSYVRFGTYNANNLFDHHDDPATKDETTRPKSDQSLAALAEVIHDGRFDVLALQEVENIQILEEFRQSGRLSEEYPHSVLIEGNDRRGADVALLSRFPLTNVKSHKDESFPAGSDDAARLPRDLLQVDVILPNQPPLRLFVTHLTSQIGGDWSDRQRLAEAQAVRRIVEREMAEYPGRAYLLMGDINDEPGSEPMRALLSDGHLCDPLSELGNSDPSLSTRRRDVERYGESRFDHVLVSADLRERVLGGRVHHHPREAWASDHRPVSLDIAA